MVTLRMKARPGSQRSPSGSPPEVKAGFTIIEVVLAIVILAVGLLGTAGTTLLFVKQTIMADATTDRAIALQSTIEGIRALPFDSVGSGRDSVGAFDVAWTVNTNPRWKRIEIVTTGPGMASAGGFPALAQSVPDTFTYRILRR